MDTFRKLTKRGTQKNIGQKTGTMTTATGNKKTVKDALDKAKENVQNNPVIKGLCMTQLNALSEVKTLNGAMEALENLKTALTSEYKFRLFTDVEQVNLILKEAAGYAGSQMPSNSKSGRLARVELSSLYNNNDETNNPLEVTAANLGMRNNNGNGKANSVNNTEAAKMANKAMSTALVVRNNNNRINNNGNTKNKNSGNSSNNEAPNNYNSTLKLTMGNGVTNDNLAGGAKKRKMKKKTTTKSKTMKKKTTKPKTMKKKTTKTMTKKKKTTKK